MTNQAAAALREALGATNLGAVVLTPQLAAALLADYERLEGELRDALDWNASCRQAHATLSRAIKRAIGIRNWPDLHAKYGSGLFAEGVGRLLDEHCSAQAAEIERLKAALARARELSSPVTWGPEETAFWNEVDP